MSFIYVAHIHLISLIERLSRRKGDGWSGSVRLTMSRGRDLKYAARIHDDSQIRADFTAANKVISELRADNKANRTHIRSLVGMFDVLAEKTRVLDRCGKLYVQPLTPTPLWKSRRIWSNGPITVVLRSSTTSTLIITFYFGYVFCILNIMFYYILYLLNFPNSGIVKILHKF